MKFLRSLERLVYPDRCIICGDVTLEKAPFCKDCIKEFVSLFSAECPSCGKTAHECACGGGKKDFLFFYSSLSTNSLAFPSRWARTLIAPHKSAEAKTEVQKFLNESADFPATLKNFVYESAWVLMNQVPYVDKTPKPATTTATTKKKAATTKKKK